ncbi:TonB-dependent receptor [Massilia aurea]|uniref:TonB-dependent receptor n=1 Tax=Massilia aurea TaxID=373040 RepID=UPI0034618C30
MLQFSAPPMRRSVCSCAVSAALLVMTPEAVLAQAQTQTAPPPAAQSDNATNASPAADASTSPAASTVLVRGTRESERSSNARKKNAATAQDSIVADDVGSFPDRNVAEAISRIAGVSLVRDDFGEGSTVSVRGNTPDLNRVEIDGIGVVSGGGTDLNGGGEGRGVSLQDMPAELISSVDVVKGATADMTEGSLGGSIIIKTRTGLDFKKQTIVARAAAEQNTLARKWTPSLNLIFADNYLDGRFGIVANVTKTDSRNEAHSVSQNSGARGGYLRVLDFDNAPEKTFSFRPDVLTADDPASTSPLASWARSAAAGGGRVNALSPQEILNRSAAAQSKAACETSFPMLQNGDVAGLSSADASRARNQRINELRTCLGQWNDYSPDLLRNTIRRNRDQRTNADLRADFKVNRDLTVYAKYNRSDRTLDEDILNLSLGNIALNGVGTFADAAQVGGVATRTPVAGSNVYFYNTPTNAGSSSTYRGITNGQVANVIPSSVRVDANHHLTGFTLANGVATTDQITSEMENKTQTGVLGGSWKSGGLNVEFLGGRTKSDFYRYGWRSSISTNYGPVDVAVSPNGLWTHTPQNAGFDQGDPAGYSALASSAPGMPLRTAGVNGTQLTLDNPRLNEMTEDVLKLDARYAVGRHVSFLQNIKAGLNGRKMGSSSWGTGGYNVSSDPLVVVPDLAVRSFFYGCQDTSASAGTANACRYGTNPAATALANPRDIRDVSIVMTPAEYNSVIGQVLTRQTNPFFAGAKDRPDTLVNGWTELDLRKLWALTGVPNMNPLDCLKECEANDGKRYAQPVTQVAEKVMAGYLSTDFAFDRIPFTERALPFGWELEGNFGYRYVKTKVSGTSSTTFQAVTPNPAGGEVTSAFRRNSTLARDTTDIMPILNLALWPIKDELVLRYNRAKQIARPPASRLTGSSVVCTNDYTALEGGGEDDDSTMSCSGVMGNPSLRAQTNLNQNGSLEWYPNRDTVLGLTAFRSKGIIGAAQRVGVVSRPFAGTGETDPLGRSLEDVAFSYSTWENGPALLKKGIEMSGKTAFTFLPSFLANTGVSANYTRLRTTSLEGQIRDLLTGAPLDPVGQERYSWNTSLWYDDGALQMRVALQVVTSTFSRIADDDSFSNFPATGVTTVGALPYNPGSPVFRDGRRFIDAKIAYRFANGVELFAEARNLGKSTVTNSQGAFAPFSDGVPSINDYIFGGARYMVGMIIRK